MSNSLSNQISTNDSIGNHDLLNEMTKGLSYPNQFQNPIQSHQLLNRKVSISEYDKKSNRMSFNQASSTVQDNHEMSEKGVDDCSIVDSDSELAKPIKMKQKINSYDNK